MHEWQQAREEHVAQFNERERERKRIEQLLRHKKCVHVIRGGQRVLVNLWGKEVTPRERQLAVAEGCEADSHGNPVPIVAFE